MPELFTPEVFENNALSPIATRLVPDCDPLAKAFAPRTVLDGKEPAPLPTVRPEIDASLAVVSVVPLKVRLAESVNRPEAPA